MSLLLSPNLTNAVVDSVIDAAKAANLAVPWNVNRLHSNGSPHRPNLWHQAQGASNRDNVIAPQTRRQALEDLNQITAWAVELRDSDGVQTRLNHEKRHRQRRMASPKAAGKKAMDQAVAIDEALRLHVLEKIFEEPKIARQQIKAHLVESNDPAMVMSQLERTPDVYGEVLGTRRFGVNSGNRHSALAVIRDQVVGPVRQALGHTGGTTAGHTGASQPPKPMTLPESLPDPSTASSVNHHILAFDAAVTRLATTHAALMKSDVAHDISMQKPGTYWHGHGGPAPGLGRP